MSTARRPFLTSPRRAQYGQTNRREPSKVPSVLIDSDDHAVSKPNEIQGSRQHTAVLLSPRKSKQPGDTSSLYSSSASTREQPFSEKTSLISMPVFGCSHKMPNSTETTNRNSLQLNTSTPERKSKPSRGRAEHVTELLRNFFQQRPYQVNDQLPPHRIRILLELIHIN